MKSKQLSAVKQSSKNSLRWQMSINQFHNVRYKYLSQFSDCKFLLLTEIKLLNCRPRFWTHPWNCSNCLSHWYLHFWGKSRSFLSSLFIMYSLPFIIVLIKYLAQYKMKLNEVRARLYVTIAHMCARLRLTPPSNKWALHCSWRFYGPQNLI